MSTTQTHTVEAPSDVQETDEEERRRQIEKNQPLIRLLESWLADDSEEPRETWEYLKKVLDEDRLSDRKLFP